MAFGAPHKHVDAPDRMTVLVDDHHGARRFVKADERGGAPGSDRV
jgi:hypothetical protein